MHLKRGEIHELSIFLAIVQHRSFRKAADQLEVTGPAMLAKIGHAAGA